jgi:hypothetical protein
MNKKLLWFSPPLSVHKDNLDPAFEFHRRWYELTKKNVCLVDSTDISKRYNNGLDFEYVVEKQLGFNVTDTDIHSGKYWHNNFKQLAHKLSNGVFDRAEKYDELALSYSGGTDSTFTLAALLSNPRIDPWLKSGKFVIYSSAFSKIEDPLVWRRIIEMKIPLRLIDYDQLSMDNSNRLFVTGDGEGYGTWWQIMLDDFSNDEIFGSYTDSTHQKLQQWFLDREKTGLTWESFNAFKQSSPRSIPNLQQAWTWFENCVAIQCYSFRTSSYGCGPVNPGPRDNLIWFMADKDFWDMCDYEAHNVIYKDDSILKYQCLKYIADWMKWPDIKVKNKFYSQYAIPKLNRKYVIYSDYSYKEDLKWLNGTKA